MLVTLKAPMLVSLVRKKEAVQSLSLVFCAVDNIIIGLKRCGQMRQTRGIHHLEPLELSQPVYPRSFFNCHVRRL